MGLRTPGGIDADGLPSILAGRIHNVRLGPRRIVAQVKLPVAVEGDCSFAQAIGNEGCGVSRRSEQPCEQQKAESLQACRTRTGFEHG
jgi:hypothetical protein